MRQMAGQSQCPIVLFGRKLHHYRTQGLPKLLQKIKIFGPGVFSGSEDGNAAFEQIGTGKCGTCFFAAGQGMAAQITATAWQPLFQVGHDRLLGAAGVG